MPVFTNTPASEKHFRCLILHTQKNILVIPGEAAHRQAITHPGFLELYSRGNKNKTVRLDSIHFQSFFIERGRSGRYHNPIKSKD